MAEGTEIDSSFTTPDSSYPAGDNHSQEASFLRTLCLEGRVFSGKGEGAEFMKLPWVKKQVKEKLGFVPYPGTLDVRITEQSVKLKRTLAEGDGAEILPAAGFCRGKCFKACFKIEPKCALIVPEVAGYPENLVEIIGPQNLRKKFHLSDGDSVQIKVML